MFVDEAHRALAKSYRDLAAHYAGALQLGLTATPYRADNRPLADAYDELVVVASVRELIAQGHLVEPRVFTVPEASLDEPATEDGEEVFAAVREMIAAIGRAVA